MHLKNLAVLVTFLAAGCAPWRLWSEVAVPPSPIGTPSTAEVPDAPAQRRKSALFYSDLGPDTVDVTSYPAERKHDYVVYTRVCSQCHSLARSINAPYVNRAWWEFYVASMRVRAKFQGQQLSLEDVLAVFNFLDYDSNHRKVEHASEFEAIKAELKRRFDAALDERVETLQQQPQPRLLP